MHGQQSIKLSVYIKRSIKLLAIMTSQDIFSALIVFKPTPPTNMKQQCQSCPFTQIKSFKENYGTQNIVNNEFVTHKYAAAEDVRDTHTLFNRQNYELAGRSNSSHELKHT
jgi:hypothetical protein